MPQKHYQQNPEELSQSCKEENQELTVDNILDDCEKQDTSKLKPIGAFVIVSESELVMAVTGILGLQWYKEWPEQNTKLFESILYDLGCDTNQPIEWQESTIHRNRMNKVVECRRWACYERIDEAWINSGYASREAINKASGSKLLADLNRFAYIQE